MEYFVETDAWLLSLIFFGLMCLGWGIGYFAQQKFKWQKEGSTRMEDACLAVFGLLMAFSFSSAVNHYEARKIFVQEDAIAIGDIAAVVSALKEPARSQLHSKLIEYAKQRITFSQIRFDDPKFDSIVEDGRQLHQQMSSIIESAINDNNTPTLHRALMAGFNGLTKAHDKRLYGTKNHIAGSIVLLLMVFAFYAAFATGYLSHIETANSLTAFRVIAYASLITLTFATIIDLEQPRRGLVRTSQVPMYDVLKSLESSR